MAHQRLGDRDEARKWYDAAVAWMEQNKRDDQELRQLRDEVERLLGIETK